MTPDKTTIDACLSRLRATWPTLDDLPDPVATLSLNRIQQVLEQEGLEAITPARIGGWKEIAEGYLLPFHDVVALAPSPSKPPPGGPTDQATFK